MRLLHSETLQFREFFDRNVPQYAILSHRWGDMEVSFQDMEQNRAPDGSRMDKIKGCCRQAHQGGLEWVWVDTCCIDKKSSAELTEAINSMFNWYYRAETCYVYLSDVTSRDREKSLRQLKKSQWFTRGWTLQELLAPEHCLFFNAMWEPLGTKKGLLSDLADITNIDPMVLVTHDIKRALRIQSVAQRMSWAATRITTRVEDEAYCLLGIFDINMPLLYGEGARAFRRLQLEIIKESSDESIFGWGLTTANRPLSSILAPLTRVFVHCEHVMKQEGRPRSSSVTNLGLKILVPEQALIRDQCIPSLSMHLELHCNIMQLPQGRFTGFRPLVLHLQKVNHAWCRSGCSWSNGSIHIGDSDPASHPEMEDTKVYLDIEP